MAWPTPQDYNEALQNPRLNCEDPDLRSGIPDVTPLGLPRPITGGFASVYSFRSGSKRWAVRCFLRDFSDHRERYAEIARHLAAARLPYTVHFQFLEKGIRVRGQWYPILKMEWIEGATFHDAIEANIQTPAALANLAERWVKMLGALKKHGIAHGDLQHGNVLIAGGDFRLIDYDGMFVPSFAGKTSHEVGHRNYQHPVRTEADFGPHLDNFSGWVIYFTLMTLSIDPSLWKRYGNSQEQLLFQKEDFDQPRFSRLFRNLRHLKDDRIQKYLPLFESFLGMRLLSIASPADVIGAPLKKRQPRQVPLPSWSSSSQLDMFAPAPIGSSDSTAAIPEPAAVIAIAEADGPAAGLNGITEGVTDNAEAAAAEMPAADSVTFTQPAASERVLLASYAAFMATLIGLAVRGTVPGMETLAVVLAGFVCSAACLMCSYLASDEARTKFVLWLHLELRRYRCHAMQYGVARMTNWGSSIDLKGSREMRRFTERDLEGVRREKDRIAEVKDTLALWIDELNLQRKALDQAEADEAAQHLRRLRERHALLLGEGAFLSNLPKDELRGRDLKTFVRWSQFIDELAQAGPPAVISSEDRAKIRSKYDLDRHSVRRSEALARMRARKKILKIHRNRQRQHQRLDSNRDAVRLRFERRKQRLQKTCDRGAVWLGKSRTELTRNITEMNRYRNIRFSKYVRRIFALS